MKAPRMSETLFGIHGTALELAGSGRADPGSLLVAIEQAMEMVARVAPLVPLAGPGGSKQVSA